MQPIIAFLQEVRGEWSRIVWPTRAEAMRLSFVVIVLSIAVGAFVGGLDFVFTNLMNVLVNR